MLWTALRLVVTLTILVAVPGYLLVQACFPPHRARIGRLERGFLAAAGGVLLVALVGVVLGLLPHATRGFYSTLATGLPNAELALGAASAVLFAVGLKRGAYPALEARFRARRRGPTAQQPGAGSLRE